jgi:single-strand DNA-binding protein
MSDINQVMLTGRLTADPEMRYTPAGKAIASFNLANGRRYKNQSGEVVEDTSFIGCTAFGQSAEFMGQYIRKGQAILVQGRLKQETWEDRQTGKKQSKTKVLVDVVKSMGQRSTPAQQAPKDEYQPTPETTPAIDAMADDEVPF